MLHELTRVEMDVEGYCMRVAGKKRGKGKGYDIGYALAANSCEGAHSVDTCTFAAL